MKVRVKLSETAIQAATRYFNQAKEHKARAEGTKRGIADLELKIRELNARIAKKAEQAAKEAKPRVVVRSARKKEWFETYQWFRTSGGRLVIAGKDATQNEQLVGKYLLEKDLFFHADIAGGATTILKDGTEANGQERLEAAQWAACFSKAWKLGYTSLDVYAVNGDQVDKRAPSGEYISKGSFMIHGKREWYRNTPLALVLAKGKDDRLEVLPANHADKPRQTLEIGPGAVEKGEAGERIKARLGLESQQDELSRLPGSVQFRA